MLSITTLFISTTCVSKTEGRDHLSKQFSRKERWDCGTAHFEKGLELKRASGASCFKHSDHINLRKLEKQIMKIYRYN